MLRCTTKESQCLLLNVALSVTICHSVKATLCPETLNVFIDVSLSVHFDHSGRGTSVETFPVGACSIPQLPEPGDQ